MSFFKEYYHNGNLKVKGIETAGVKEGKWIFFFENGNVLKEVHFKNGVESGSWKMWHPNGNLYIEQTKRDGKSDGDWTEYYENGKTKETGIFKKGNYSPINFWDENGIQTLVNGNGSKIEKFGYMDNDVYKHYFENGIFLREEKISDTRFGPFKPL